MPKNTDDLISSMARDAVKGEGVDRKGDIKTIAKDILAAVEAGSGDDLASALEALGEAFKAGDED